MKISKLFFAKCVIIAKTNVLRLGRSIVCVCERERERERERENDDELKKRKEEKDSDKLEVRKKNEKLLIKEKKNYFPVKMKTCKVTLYRIKKNILYIHTFLKRFLMSRNIYIYIYIYISEASKKLFYIIQDSCWVPFFTVVHDDIGTSV